MESCLGRKAKSPMVTVLYVFALLAVVLVHGARASSFCQEVVEPLGYGCTEFAVETNDGFVLEMHRLSRVKSLVQSADRGSAPAVDKSPAYSRAPTNRGQVVSQYPQDHGLSPAVMLTPSDGSNSSINDSSSAAAHYIGSSPGQALKVPRNRSTDAQHSDSVNATHRSKRRHHHSQRSSPGAPEASRSSNRTSGNSSSQQHVVAASPAPTSTQNASSSSTQEQSQRTTDSGTPSNYTANPKAGKGSPVFLMHQEFFNGDTWFAFVDSENRTSSNLLPIMLLNDGFDVWIGHQRATYWSHGHVHLKPTDREYWDWTWDEHVKYDLPAQLLFISTETNQPVHFIGASQAATVGTAATTDHDIAMMIRSLTLIGPTAYRGYTSSLLLEAWAYFFGSAIDSGYYAMGYQNGAFNYSTAFPQTGPYAAQGLNTPAMALISGPNCCLGSVPIRFTNGWDGTTSFKNLLHWQQGIRSNNFSHYDYGNPVSNMQAYGRATPPAYNVEQIPSHLPILIIGGGRDWFAPPQGISLLLSQLQQQATLINLTNYAHYDLGFSARRETDMYLPILGFLEGL